MKKTFLLSKGLNKFSDQQLKNMETIVGGIATIPVEIYYPTSGGRRCVDGQVWSETLQRCVSVIAVELKRK